LKTMTKSELIARLAERNPRLVARDADEAVNTMLDAMTDALAGGQRIEIRGFGSFALNYRPPRVGRNPKSGDCVQVPATTPHSAARNARGSTAKPGRIVRTRMQMISPDQSARRLLPLVCRRDGAKSTVPNAPSAQALARR
jgi:integration host factor subunit beta